MVATFPSVRQFAGVALEAAQGTSVPMTYTLPLEDLQPEDKPKWLDDHAWRGAMGMFYGRQQGPIINDFTLKGPVFGDGIGFLLANILGDLVPTGTASTPSTTLSSTAAAGASSLSTAASIPAASVVLIGTGSTAEIRTTGTPSGAGPYTIPFAAGQLPLQYAHASAQAVVVQVAPFTNAWSVLNTLATTNYAQGQPPTHTITHYQGPAASGVPRVFAGACLSKLSFNWAAESQLLMFDAAATSWPSALDSQVRTPAATSVNPVASWRGKVGIGGPASGGTQVLTVETGSVDITRALEPIFTEQLAQTPYIIQRGEAAAAGKLEFVAADESPYLAMIGNTQPTLQFTLTNGLAGASLISVQFDVAAAAYRIAKIETGKKAIRYGVEWDGVFTTANAGGSGGYSPIKVTIGSAVAGNTYQ
ncbi:phage tail tube protein [Actinocrispum wychmicini]|uniref:Tail protein n=1 Tax=Actinocrispum wychmicini TaxID=1213861 RepID=A0A4R2JC58_9PSEU|nr:phage tail tube protein [Actinocrispum wychmicini]TCO57121.1 hypothetical protein EV192_106598 [Actinocrispum wychmicini]